MMAKKILGIILNVEPTQISSLAWKTPTHKSWQKEKFQHMNTIQDLRWNHKKIIEKMHAFED
jgi:hypothetical protein